MFAFSPLLVLAARRRRAAPDRAWSVCPCAPSDSGEGGHRVSGRTFRSPPPSTNRSGHRPTPTGAWPPIRRRGRRSTGCSTPSGAGLRSCSRHRSTTDGIPASRRWCSSRGPPIATSAQRRPGAAARRRGAAPSTISRCIWSAPTPCRCSSAAAWYAAGQPFDEAQRRWFVAHARGRPFRSLDLPIDMTRRMEHLFLKSPAHFGVAYAMAAPSCSAWEQSQHSRTSS